MNLVQNEVTINGVVYVMKESDTTKAESFEGMPYQIVRTFSAGVFAGYVASRNGQEVVVKKARRLWRWEGAASLSQLAMEGTSCPKECKFPCEVDSVLLLNAIEILDVTEKSKKSISEVAIWKA
jgi:hypothetical protein